MKILSFNEITVVHKKQLLLVVLIIINEMPILIIGTQHVADHTRI